MKLGDLVTLTIGSKAGWPHVVVHPPKDGVVQLCYCGSKRWYVPEWHPVSDVASKVPDGRRLRRARKLLAELKPDGHGWLRISVGRYGSPHPDVVVGHIDHGALARPTP